MRWESGSGSGSGSWSRSGRPGPGPGPDPTRNGPGKDPEQTSLNKTKVIIKHKSLRLHSIPTRSYSEFKMKINSAACLLFLLCNAAGSSIREGEDQVLEMDIAGTSIVNSGKYNPEDNHIAQKLDSNDPKRADAISGGMTHRALRKTIRPSALKTSAPTGSPTAISTAFKTSAPTGSPTAISTASVTNATKDNIFSGEPTTGNSTSIHKNTPLMAAMSSWMNGAGAMWAWDCDFPRQGDYMTVTKQNGAQCDPLCARDPKCTHFTYNPYADGSCYLKTDGAFKNDAKPATPGMGILCGIKKLSTPPLIFNRENWMSDLPDRAELEDFLLPGTHNAIAGPQSAYTPWTPLHLACDLRLWTGGSFSQCQSDSIRSQLYRGVRYFEFRLAECKPPEYDWFAGDQSLCFWHGTSSVGDYLDLSLEKVQWELFWFLQHNPRETIIVQISLEYGHDKVKKEEFRGRVERYFEGHHEYWQHFGTAADIMNSNLRLGQVRGRIVVFWDCEFCGPSKYGLDYRKIVNRYAGPNGDHSWPNAQAKLDNFLSRARENRVGATMRGWYENKAAWTYTVWCYGWVPLYPGVVNSWTNPKVLDVLNGKYGTGISQKGILSMDFPTDDMIRQIIAVTRVRQLAYTTDINFYG